MSLTTHNIAELQYLPWQIEFYHQLLAILKEKTALFIAGSCKKKEEKSGGKLLQSAGTS
jgi:hypothetical protein